LRLPSLNHLVGAREQHCGNIDTDRPRGFQVDDQIELGGPLNGQIAGLLAFEDAAGINTKLTKRPMLSDAVSSFGGRRYVRAQDELHDLLDVLENVRRAIRQQDARQISRCNIHGIADPHNLFDVEIKRLAPLADQMRELDPDHGILSIDKLTIGSNYGGLALTI